MDQTEIGSLPPLHNGGGKKVRLEFICPITQDIMFDPVIAADNNRYERHAISTWIASSKKATSPLTNLPLAHKELTSDKALQERIQGAFPENFEDSNETNAINQSNSGKKLPAPKPSSRQTSCSTCLQWVGPDHVTGGEECLATQARVRRERLEQEEADTIAEATRLQREILLEARSFRGEIFRMDDEERMQVQNRLAQRLVADSGGGVPYSVALRYVRAWIRISIAQENSRMGNRGTEADVELAVAWIRFQYAHTRLFPLNGSCNLIRGGIAAILAAPFAAATVSGSSVLAGVRTVASGIGIIRDREGGVQHEAENDLRRNDSGRQMQERNANENENNSDPQNDHSQIEIPQPRHELFEEPEGEQRQHLSVQNCSSCLTSTPRKVRKTCTSMIAGVTVTIAGLAGASIGGAVTAVAGAAAIGAGTIGITTVAPAVLASRAARRARFRRRGRVADVATLEEHQRVRREINVGMSSRQEEQATHPGPQPQPQPQSHIFFASTGSPNSRQISPAPEP